jgi:glycolate oxidase FAD binding subunit
VLELEQVLAEQGQMLPFEPPRFGAAATVGGMIACGLSGPRRPWAGAMRDAVLGMRCINGRGEQLRFGGEVVKNVAGFDVSRLMVGALGTLGVILEVSIKVIPRPVVEQTRVFDCSEEQARTWMTGWSSSNSLPLSGAVFDGQQLFVRLSGSTSGVNAAVLQLGGEELSGADGWWSSLREHQHAFFRDPQPLWRLSLPAAARPVNIIGDWLHDWGGSQRWLKTALQSNIIREMAQRAGGSATLFRGGDRQGMVFHPLSPALHAVHKELKAAFDPRHLFNRGCLYPDI